MGWVSFSAILLVVLALLLVSVGIEDARAREIANWKNAAIALLAPLWWWANGLSLWPGVALILAIALGVFVLFALAFRVGWMGGGDVKLIGALALWLPPLPLVNMLMLMSLIGGGLTLLLLGERAVRRAKGGIEIPYGVAIAAAALLTLREPIFNQLS